MANAMFGAGCFWGVEATFRAVKGVSALEVGYAGGDKDNATYEEVCAGNTGHAEVVRIDFDPGTVSYGELLDVFWGCHNPTTLNRQGPDHGSQYRSVIFTFDDGQRADA
ncbi:MAG: peptide-methionine (S)-S-oxide reductase MsrA, partial [Sphingomonadales bacterium]